MINLKIKKLHEEVTLPSKAHDTDACFDIYADCSENMYYDYVYNHETEIPEYKCFEKAIKIKPGEWATIHTGFCTEIPEGYFAPVFCRSGMGIKRHLRLCNSVGIIDSSYRGEWLVALHNDGTDPQIIRHGDRIAQFTLLPVLDVNIEEVKEVSDSERGSGGFGSSGR